jgi:sodium/potassium-transporting ATPase subunit alpha
VPFSDIVLAYGGYKGGLSDDFVAEQVNRAQSVYFFTLIVCLFSQPAAINTNMLSFFLQGMQWGQVAVGIVRS